MRSLHFVYQPCSLKGSNILDQDVHAEELLGIHVKIFVHLQGWSTISIIVLWDAIIVASTLAYYPRIISNGIPDMHPYHIAHAGTTCN